jgi:hypothetical protein
MLTNERTWKDYARIGSIQALLQTSNFLSPELILRKKLMIHIEKKVAEFILRKTLLMQPASPIEVSPDFYLQEYLPRQNVRDGLVRPRENVRGGLASRNPAR